MGGDEGVPKQRGCFQRIVLIRIQKGCVFPVWVPLQPPVGRFVWPSVWWSAFVRPLCVGRAAAFCWPLSVLHSVCDIHSLHVVHRLRCGALAHESLDIKQYLVKANMQLLMIRYG